MISSTIQSAINDQIKHEFFSSYLYLSMSAYFETLSLPGFASWMRVQSQEEHEHAMKFFDFLNDRGGSVELQALDSRRASSNRRWMCLSRRWITNARSRP